MLKQIFFIVVLLSIVGLALGCTNFNENVKVLEEKPVKNMVEFEIEDISLTQNQLDNFQAYVRSGNEQLLKDLSPMDIFKYYYHAYKLDDEETLYGFYVKGQRYETPNKKEFLNNYQEKDILQMSLLKRLEENIESLAQIKYDENTMYVQIKFKEDTHLISDQPWIFKLIKNREDIWKMDWIPLNNN